MNTDAIAEVERLEANECLHMSEYHCLLMAMEWAYIDAAEIAGDSVTREKILARIV